MADYMADLGQLIKTNNNRGTTTKKVADQSTNVNAGQGLDMTDFLTLMVEGFKNQDMENPASTTDMMNQLVQMSVVTAITNINSLISESTVMTYAASLVGKTVTMGKLNAATGKVDEIEGVITGTGTLNGKQVVFVGDDTYYLTDIMAIGKLPADKDKIDPDDTKPGDSTNKPDEGTGGVEKPGEGSGSTDETPSTGTKPDGTPNVPGEI